MIIMIQNINKIRIWHSTTDEKAQ